MKLHLLINFFLTYTIGLRTSCVAGIDIMSKYTTQNQVCMTSGCIKAARIILENMDKNVNPCENFYRFACGNYMKESDSQEDEISASVLDQANERLREQLNTIIEDKKKQNDCRTFFLLKSHYNSCLDVEKIEQTSRKNLLDILRKLDWPVLVGKIWNESRFNWTDLICHLRQMGYKESINSFIELTIEVDEKNNTKYLIVLDQAETEFSSEYLSEGMKDERVQAYYRYMVNIAKALGVNKKHQGRELSDLLAFEIKFAKIILQAAEARNESQLYNLMTIKELQSSYPGIPWRKYIDGLLQPYHMVKPNELVIIRDPNYIKLISDLIYVTPKRILANYVIWRVIQESIPFMNYKFQNIESKLKTDITGADTQTERWEICIDYVIENMPLAAGALYVRKIFDKNLKKEGQELVQNLRQSFKKILEQVDWMDNKTKRASLRKLNSMYAHIAYPDELFDDKKLDEYFKNVELVPDSYLDSYLTMSLLKINNTYQRLGKSNNKTDWVKHGSSAVVNAFYDLSENSIEIPAGFFQEELFGIDRPNYMNYAGIGYFIGHELTHAFDDDGSQYDEEGNLVDWWDSKTQKEYQERIQCIVDQYSNYTVEEVGLQVDGKSTQGENIADNGGIKQAYLAYAEYERRNGPEPRLPGLPYSPRQLFWLSNANVYCEKYSSEDLEYEMATDEHSPGEFRVIGAFSNVPEFARDFECPLGSFMNPVKKCTLW